MIQILEFIKYFQQQSKPRGVVCYRCEKPWCGSMALLGSGRARVFLPGLVPPGCSEARGGSRPVTPRVPLGPEPVCPTPSPPWRALPGSPVPLPAELSQRKARAAGPAAPGRGCSTAAAGPRRPWPGILSWLGSCRAGQGRS